MQLVQYSQNQSLLDTLQMETRLNLFVQVLIMLFTRESNLLLLRFGGNQVVLGGGVAKNEALLEYLKSDYDKVMALEDPQFNGAIGCCHYGLAKAGVKKVEENHV